MCFPRIVQAAREGATGLVPGKGLIDGRTQSRRVQDRGLARYFRKYEDSRAVWILEGHLCVHANGGSVSSYLTLEKSRCERW